MELEAKRTLHAVELDCGDEIRFKLRNGSIRTFALEETDAQVLFTTQSELMVTLDHGGVTLYHFTAKVRIDGQPMTMERYVGSQESFYEPYAANGMRIWFDGVSKIFDKGLVNENHGPCKPHKDARFAISDMTESICPEEVHCPLEMGETRIDAATCYNGDDMWMGAYDGFEAHGGLDINLPRGTPSFAPFSMDDHYLIRSLANGGSNNSWHGVRTWRNGDTWFFRNAHMLNLRIPEHERIPAGRYYADAGGVHSGDHHHSHFVFTVKTRGSEEEVLLDPWIVFWQAFENARKRRGEVRASIAPLEPARTGEPVAFSSKGSRPGSVGGELCHTWTFGDGGWSNEARPRHAFASPGVYPITLVVDDGAHKATFTQHISVNGRKVSSPALVLAAEDEPSFCRRPVQMMDTYGDEPRMIPHTLHFLARETRPEPGRKNVRLLNAGSGELATANVVVEKHNGGADWLRVSLSGEGNAQELTVGVNGTDLPMGTYSATVHVSSPGALNSRQGFRVQLTIPTCPPAHRRLKNMDWEVIDNHDIRAGHFFCTPYFWIMPSMQKLQKRGHADKFHHTNGVYHTNGGRAVAGEFVRFTPDLPAGTFDVALAEETPFEPEARAVSRKGSQPVNPEYNPNSRFKVRVRSANGDETIWMEPHKSRKIGRFTFEEGMDGFVEILAEESTGQVLADAVTFARVAEE